MKDDMYEQWLISLNNINFEMDKTIISMEKIRDTLKLLSGEYSKRIQAKILELEYEKQILCGDGTGGPVTSHSTSCRCNEIDGRIKKLESVL